MTTPTASNSAPGITLSINAASTQQNSSVIATGYVQHAVTSDDLAAFGLDTNGAQYFADVFGGGNSPDEMWWTQPANSRWGDLYAAYPQIKPPMATLSVQSATVTEITSTPQILASQTFTNNSSKPATMNCGVVMEVSTTAETSWSSTVTYEVSQSVSYEMSFLGSGASGETSFSFSQEFGQGGSTSNTSTLGQSTGLTVELTPGQSVIAELTASQGTMVIDVVYQLTLSGGVFGTFESPYQWPNDSSYGSHYIWMVYDVNSLLNAGNAPQVLTVTETITVGFFANSSATLTDPTTAKVIARTRRLGSAVPVEVHEPVALTA